MTFPDNSVGFTHPFIAGTVIIKQTGQGLFVYQGTPGPGTLLVAIAAVAGTDPYGNTYVRGISVETNAIVRAFIGNAKLDLQANLPSVFFNPDTTLYNTDGGIQILTFGTDSGQVTIATPFDAGGGKARAFVQLVGYNGTLASFIELGAMYTIADGFIHSSANSKAVKTVSTALGIGGVSGAVVCGTITVATIASREYKIWVSWHGVFSAGATADNYSFAISRTGLATALATQRQVSVANAASQLGGALIATDTPGAGNTTYNFTINHETGAAAAQTSNQGGVGGSPYNVLAVEGFA